MQPIERRGQARGDLSVAQWTLIQGVIPKQDRGGKCNDHRRVAPVFPPNRVIQVACPDSPNSIARGQGLGLGVAAF